MKLIIAPHEIHEGHLKSIEARLHRPTIRLSQATEQNVADQDCLIVDSFGLLSSLYRYGQIAYIGGGFGAGIHNTLEAATFGKPICFGKRYTHFQEAVDLVERKAAFSISDAESLRSILIRLNQDKDFYSHAADVSLSYTKEKAGACRTILQYLNL